MPPSPVPPPPPFAPPPAMPPPPAPTPPSGSSARVVIGLVLLVPAVIAMLVGYLIPSVQTAIWSLQERPPFEGESEFVGFDNYRAVLGELPGGVGFALLLGLIPMFVMLVVAPLLALVAHAGGRPARLMVRLGLVFPMVCVAPVGWATGWLIDRFDVEASARVTVWLAAGFSMIGLVCGVGVTFFLGVLRGREPGRPVWLAGLTVAGLGLLAVLALALQVFTFPWVLTRGGPERQTTTAMLDEFEFGLEFFDFGAGAVPATLLLIPLMALGLTAGALVVASRLRIEYGTASHGRPRGWAVAVSAIGLVAVLGVTLYGLWPWLSRLTQIDAGSGDRTATVLVNTWLPPLVSTVIGVGLATVAAFGIGALRPLGRYSEILLLPFAPWLFIGIGPLFLVKFDTAVQLDLDPFVRSIPPILLAVPALFVLTLVFRGLASRFGDLGQVTLRALPMVALVGAATWLVQSQGLLWALLADSDTERWGGPLTVTLFANQFGASNADAFPLGLVLPIPAIVVFGLGLAALHVFYLDRLAIRAGRER